MLPACPLEASQVNHKSPTHEIHPHLACRVCVCTRLVSRMKVFGGSFARARARTHLSQDQNVRAPERYRLVILCAVCHLLLVALPRPVLFVDDDGVVVVAGVAVASCWHKNYLPFCVFFFLWFIYIITLCVTIIPNAYTYSIYSHHRCHRLVRAHTVSIVTCDIALAAVFRYSAV